MPSDSEVVSVDDHRSGPAYHIGSGLNTGPRADKAHEHGGGHPARAELGPEQNYYLVSASWGKAPPAPSAVAGAILGSGTGWVTDAATPGAWVTPPETREKWTISRADDGYHIKSAEHGSYLGYHGGGLGGANFGGAHNVGLTGSKTPFSWASEPHKRGDGVFRFTVPQTELHVDFASADGSGGDHDGEQWAVRDAQEGGGGAEGPAAHAFGGEARAIPRYNFSK